MSKTIDDRIVRMSFDTSKFQNGVKGVLDGLKSIDKSLGTKRTFSGLDGVNKSISDLTGKGISSLSNSIADAGSRFSALEIAGVTALVNISNRAVDTGINLVKSLTLDPIMEGFREYETKMQSIQTILTNTASKGTTLKDVTATLDELNEYADKTIYNFAAMTKNIGTFTAAGVGLEQATTAIKGIANLGAGVGSTNQQVETAMYQMSQALSQGYLMLQDYNSLVNAGMGGEMFKKEAIEVAKSMGIVTPALKDFRGSLEDKWLTDGVMMKVFENFANDEMLTKAATEVKTLTGLLDTLKESVGSGWAQTWESIVGDKDQATKLFTGISNAINNGLINPMADARTAVIDTWLAMDGRSNLIKGFANIWENLSRILGPIGEAFNKVFPKTFGATLGYITKGFLQLTEALMINKEFSGYISDAFTFLFTVINNGIKIIGFFLQPLKHVFNAIVGIARVIGELIVAFIRVTYVIGDYIRELTIVKQAQEAFNKGVEFIQRNAEKFTNAFDNMVKGISGFVKGITEGINGLFKTKDKTEGVSKSLDSVVKSSSIAEKSMGSLTKASELVGNTFEQLKTAGSNIYDMYIDAKNGAENASEGFIIFVNNTKEYIQQSGLIARATETMTEAWETMCDVGDNIKGFVKSIDFSPIINTINAVKDKLEPIVTYIKNIFNILVDAFKSVFDELDLTGGQLVALLGGFAAGFGVFKIFGKLGEIIGNILNPIGTLSEAAVGVLDGVKGVLESYQNDLQAETLKKIGLAVLMLSGALLILSQLEMSQVQTGLLGVVGILTSVITGLAILVKITSGANLKGFFSLSAAFISLSIAVMNISIAIMLLSSLGMEKLYVGLLGVAGALTMMVLALGAVGTMTGTIVKGSFALILVANALTTMYIALLLFARMDIQVMNNALMSIAMPLGVLVMACRGLSVVTGNIIQTSIGLTILAGALIIMAKATKKFGELDNKVIVKGLLSMTLIMGALMLFNASTANSKMSFSMGAGMMGLAKSLDMLIKPIEAFGKMDTSNLVKGIFSLGVVMGGLVLLTNTIKPQKGLQLITMSIGLMVFAKAIQTFINSATELKNVDTGDLVSGLFKMSLAIVAISAAIALIPERKLIMLSLGIAALSLALRQMVVTIDSAGRIPFGDLVKGILALFGALLILEGATRLSTSVGLIKLGIGLGAIALGFTAMTLPLTKLGAIDIKTLAKGLGALFGMVALFSLMNVGMAGMQLIPLAAGIALLSLALTTFVIPIQQLGSLDLKTIGTSLLVMVGVLTLLGLAALALTPLVPVLLGLGTAIGLLGSGMLAAAGGLALFSAGFALFGYTVGTFGSEILTFFVEFSKKLPELVENLALACVKLLEVLGQNGALIAESLYKILESIINAVISIIPLVVNALYNLIITIVETLTSNAAKITEAGFKLVMALLEGINTYVEPIISKMVEVLITMANALNDNLIILIDAGIKLMVNLIDGIAQGIDSNSEALGAAVNNLIFSVLEAMVGFGVDFFKRGFDFVGEMINGIFDNEKPLTKTSTDVAKSGIDGAETTKPEWRSAGKDFSSGISKGIRDGESGVVKTATSVARSAANAIKKELDINSPSKVTTEFGMYTTKGLAKGILKYGHLAANAGSYVADEAIKSIEKPINNIALLDGINSNPVVRPVIDLSDIKSGSKMIGDIINDASGSLSTFGSVNGGLITNVGNIQNRNTNVDIINALSKLRKDINSIQGVTNIIDGITYDDGSAISNTIGELVRMAKVERRR